MLTSNHYVFIVSGRQALPYARICLGSIQAQLGFFKTSTIYVDDFSQYSVHEIQELEKLVFQVNGQLILLKERHYQIGALSAVIPMLQDPDAIVCLVDGDDYLLSHALEMVDAAYQNPDIVLTYGNVLVDFRPYQDTQEKYFYDKKTVNTEYSNDVWEKCSFREDGFRCFHFRTFRRWLWDYIDPEGFKRIDGSFIRASGDSAYMFPMLELLAEKKHVSFIETPLYVYRLHAGNVHNHDKKSQSDDLNYLRFQMKKHEPLDRKVLKNHLVRSQCVASLVS